jgi:outer membrane protein
VPQALSGYRPHISASIAAGGQLARERYTVGALSGTIHPRSVGITGQQVLFDAFRTANSTRAAEGSVSAARETLRVIEQTVLLDAVAAYMNVVRDTAILEVQRNNLRLLQETLRQTRERLALQEVTRTDVAQAQAQLAAAQAQMSAAESTLMTSKAIYRRVIGSEPMSLIPGTPVDKLTPSTLAEAISAGSAMNPAVGAAMYGVDIATLQVKIAEAALYPVVTLQANVQQSADISLTTTAQFNASLLGVVTIPIYQGGTEYSAIRQTKEIVRQRRLDLETTRDQVQAAVVQAWGQREAAKVQTQAAKAQVAASKVALQGVREEALVGDRTTLDVLNAQQVVVTARVALITAQRDRVVSSYSLLSAIGRLSPKVLALRIPVNDPAVHYEQIRDAWIGVRTPAGQ